MTGDASNTAAEAATALCEQMSAESGTRIVDLTGRRIRRITGTEFTRRIERYRGALRGAGVGKRDTVLFVVRPSVDAVAAFLALLQLGATTASVHVTDPERLVAARVAKIDPGFVLTEPILAFAARSPIRRLLAGLGADIPPLRGLAPRIVTRQTRPLRAHDSPDSSTACDDDALVVFTSGTTGDPKAVVHSQHSLAATLTSLTTLIGDASRHVVYCRELHAAIPALATGAQVVIGSPDTPPGQVAASFARHGITTWFSTPSVVRRTVPLLQRPHRLQHIVLGSAPVTAALVNDLQRVLPEVQVTAIYAMTEAIPVATASGASIVAHPGDGDLVGRVVAGIEIDIDTEGGLWISGPRVGRYLGGDNDYVDTGDLAHLTEDGDLVLDGRRKDMIIVDGASIYPQHHESEFTSILGVGEGALASLTDPHGLETLWAVVDLDGTRPIDDVAAAVAANTRLRDLPLQGLVAGRLPRTGPSAKVDRIELRRTVSEALEAGDGHLIPRHR